MTSGIGTIIIPVTDLAAAKAVFGELLGVDAGRGRAVLRAVPRRPARHVGLDPNGHKQGMTGPIAVLARRRPRAGGGRRCSRPARRAVAGGQGRRRRQAHRHRQGRRRQRHRPAAGPAGRVTVAMSTDTRHDRDEARSRAQRKADTLGHASAPRPRTSGWPRRPTAGPYLVPLSLAWLDERVVLAVDAVVPDRPQHRRRGAPPGSAPGRTRDVVMIDAVLERRCRSPRRARSPTGTPRRPTGTRAGAGDGYVYLVLRPDAHPGLARVERTGRPPADARRRLAGMSGGSGRSPRADGAGRSVVIRSGRASPRTSCRSARRSWSPRCGA